MVQPEPLSKGAVRRSECQRGVMSGAPGALGQVRGRPHLPGGSVSPEIGEHPGEPVVDLIQGQLPVGGFQNGLWARRSKGTLSLGLEGSQACVLPAGISWPLTRRDRGDSPRSLWLGRVMVPLGPRRLAGYSPATKAHKPQELRPGARGTWASLQGNGC